jgi:hypothetical protein
VSSPEGSTDVYRLLAEDIDANGARPDGDVWERIALVRSDGAPAKLRTTSRSGCSSNAGR